MIVIDLLQVDHKDHFGNITERFLSFYFFRPPAPKWPTPRSPCPRLCGPFTLAPPTQPRPLRQPPPPPPPPSPAPPPPPVPPLPPLPHHLPLVLRAPLTARPTITTITTTITTTPALSCSCLHPPASSRPRPAPAPAAPAPAGASAAPAASAAAPVRESEAAARRVVATREAQAPRWMSSRRTPWRWTWGSTKVTRREQVVLGDDLDVRGVVCKGSFPDGRQTGSMFLQFMDQLRIYLVVSTFRPDPRYWYRGECSM